MASDMTDLRDKVASILRDEARIDWNLEIPDDSAARLADAILALPGIAEALECQSDADYVDARTQRQRNADMSASLDGITRGALR